VIEVFLDKGVERLVAFLSVTDEGKGRKEEEVST
jgi:hypothetical protein